MRVSVGLVSALIAWAIAVEASGARADASTTRLTIGGGTIELVLLPRGAHPSRAAIQSWTRRAASAVSSFYGKFPVPDVRIVVAEVPGRHIGGTTFEGRLVRIRLGEDTVDSDLTNDWTLTHEMLHLGFPDLDR